MCTVELNADKKFAHSYSTNDRVYSDSDSDSDYIILC